MNALIFPGQGTQIPGMGKDLFENNEEIKKLMLTANDILGFDILNIIFNGSEKELKQTKVTQPAVFIYSSMAVKAKPSQANMVAGHSLGEFSALVGNGVLSFEDGLKLVYERALAMQAACEETPSSMAAILGLADEVVENVCQEISTENNIVVPANYNCPGQLVISGHTRAVEKACETLQEKGAKRALILPVSGAFHSPLMQSAQDRLAAIIQKTQFIPSLIPVYQNVTTTTVTDIEAIKENLIKQLTAPVKWTQTIQNMVADGCRQFTETGPGKVLQGLVKKIEPSVDASSL